MERKQLAPGVFITSMSAAKFNRCRITIHLRFPAKRETATDAAVLALVLERGYAACPDMTALSRRLAELYGADLGVDLSSAGPDRVLSADSATQSYPPYNIEKTGESTYRISVAVAGFAGQIRGPAASGKP